MTPLCDLCGEAMNEPELTGPDFRVGLSVPFTLFKCQCCGLVSLQPQPSDLELAPHYPDWLWEDAIDDGTTRVSKFDPIIELLSRRHPEPGRLLDVGCGPGDFVLAVGTLHWQASGIEISRRQVEAGLRRGAALSVCEDFSHYTGAAPYDAITFNHVLEHVRSPRAYLQQARKLLKPDGTLIIAVPNYNSLSRRVFGAYWMHVDLPRHLFHFTPSTLTSLLESTGFHVVQTCFPDLKQDSIGTRESLRRWLKYGLLRRPIRAHVSSSPTKLANPSLALRYLYRKLGNGVARATETTHMADTFTIVATCQSS
jgi:SAM-dependent methyltransferase